MLIHLRSLPVYPSTAARPTLVDLLIASTLAIFGIAMARLPISFVGETLVAAVVFAFILDLAKVPVFRRLSTG